MLTLGIETSCDETAVAVVRDDGVVLSDVVQSQVKLHAPYGGVVPELASRDHLKNARPVLEAALDRAGVGLADIDGIAVTCRPGLAGALLVGVQLARGLAWATGKPLVGVDHLVGHLLAVFLQYPGEAAPEPPTLPYVALLASGGHTALYKVAGFKLADVTEIGATRDDAAGEAFDKIAKLLGLGYPGGPIVDRLAREGNPAEVQLALPMRDQNSCEFSFSGLKTDVARWVESHGRPANDEALRNLCAAFQRNVVDTLVTKAIRAARRARISTIVLGGGVAANRELRQRSTEAAAHYGIRVVVPPFKCCTDNAAMIAYAGSRRLLAGENDGLSIEINPKTALPQVTRKGKGRRVAPSAAKSSAALSDAPRR